MIEYIVRVSAEGTKYWLNKDNQLHCEHGAAVEKANGSKWWFLNGEELTEADFNIRNSKPCRSKIEEVEKARVVYDVAYAKYLKLVGRYQKTAESDIVEVIEAKAAAWDKYVKLKREYEAAFGQAGKVVEIEGVKYKLEEV